MTAPPPRHWPETGRWPENSRWTATLQGSQVHRWILRKPLVPPAWSDLSAPLQARFRLIDEAVQGTALLATCLPQAGLQGALPPPLMAHKGLHHHLTALFPPITSPIDLGRARSELAAIDRLGDPAAAIRESGALHALQHLARDVCPAATLREGDIATQADPGGRHVVFPGVETIAGQMKRLDRLLAADRREPRAFAATVALLLITNCHAFTDGNGRVARVVFNAVLRPSEPAVTHYLPLREIATFARGGYIIRARQAEIHGNWAPLADFMLAAVRFWQGRLTAQLPSARSGNSTGAPPPGRPSAAQDSLSLQR